MHAPVLKYVGLFRATQDIHNLVAWGVSGFQTAPEESGIHVGLPTTCPHRGLFTAHLLESGWRVCVPCSMTDAGAVSRETTTVPHQGYAQCSSQLCQHSS